MGEFLAVVMFLAVCGLLLAGFPVAFTLAGTALWFALLGAGLGLFQLAELAAFPSRIYGAMTNETLIAVPLFIFMGLILERSKIAEDLLDSLSRLFGNRPGGLAVSVTLVSTLLAASTGIVGATVITMGLLALPVMLRRGYDPALSAGSIAAAGTLGQIIPPSIILVLLGDTLSSAYQKAQLEQGIFSPRTLSVGDLFAGALLPGLIIAGLYISYQLFRALRDPACAPPVQAAARAPEGKHFQLLRSLIAPVALIAAVLGSILTGLATPTEAAAVGAAGAVLIAALRRPEGAWPVAAALGALAVLALARVFEAADPQTPWLDQTLSLAATLIGWPALIIFFAALLFCFFLLYRAQILTGAVRQAARITSMVFMILICAALFSLVFRGLHGDLLVRDALHALPGGEIAAFLAVMAIMFLLGFVLDFLEITFIVVPIVAPILFVMGIDPVWLGVMMAINLQTSFLTPPFGFALFYLRGIAPPEVKTAMIYKGVLPFIGLQIIALLLIGLFPQTATWLPEQLFGQ